MKHRIIPFPEGDRLGDLPDVLEALPRFTPEEAEALGHDVDEARDSLPELSAESMES